MGKRQGILRFFYAVGEVKSTNGVEMKAGLASPETWPGWLRLIAVIVGVIACFGGALSVAQAETPLAIVDDSLPTMSVRGAVQLHFPWHRRSAALSLESRGQTSRMAFQ